MIKLFVQFMLFFTLLSCSNTSDLETGEIKTLKLLKLAIDQSLKPKIFFDARNLLNRKQIDAASIPILFVELETGQNGTLTPYPGKGFGQTWLGADGATITLESGVVKASRGMGDDIMGSSSTMPHWSKIGYKTIIYSRRTNYITGDNKISQQEFKCRIHKNDKKEFIQVWEVEFKVTKFTEKCISAKFEIINSYFLDNNEIIRQSNPYHCETLGYILIPRLDR